MDRKKRLLEQRKLTARVLLAGFRSNYEFCKQIGMSIYTFRHYVKAEYFCPDDRWKLIMDAIKAGPESVKMPDEQKSPAS